MTDEEFFYQMFRAFNAYQIDDLIKGASFSLRNFIKYFNGKWHFTTEFLKWLDTDTVNGFAKLKDCYRVKFALYIDDIGVIL